MNEIINRNLWVYDIETLASCFTYTAINIDTNEQVKYVIHKEKDERILLYNHLKECKGQIGFNNISFDYPVIHYFLEIYTGYTTEELIENLYRKAQNIISDQIKDGFSNYFNPKDYKIQQLDLFKIWHYNNKARTTSLKSLQISMNYPNVMEMPIHHSKEDISLEEVDEILEYNLNDVLSTFEFYKKSKDKINLRKQLNEKYKLNCINYSDSKIGEQLILKLYCLATYKSNDTQFNWTKFYEYMKEVKQLRTYRPSIKLEKCIFDYIKFESKEFNELLNTFKTKTVSELKGSIEESVIYKGFKYSFGLGGIHGCIKPGIYESDEDYLIIDADVGAMYPSIAIVNNLYPKHLGKEFCTVYKDVLNQRMIAKKAKDSVISDALKLALNTVYGKSNEVFSPFYDPEYTVKTTLNGQLMLAMLAELLVNQLDKNITILQINTDGITVKIHRSCVEDYYNLCKIWEFRTNLNLEYVNYKKMVIRDVNNYSSSKFDNEIKYKGAFEIDKVVGNEPAYHKDNSFRIIPIALNKYFFENIPIEDTINKHTNIYDFCGKQKFKGEDVGELHYIEPFSQELIKEKQQKNTRYYISTDGDAFIKNYAKGSIEKIHVGYKVTIFNKYIQKPIKNYNIDKSFYIKECYKEIEQIENKQLQLF